MSEFRDARLSKAQILISKGFNPYSESFKVTHSTKYLNDKFSYLKSGEEFDCDVSMLIERISGSCKSISSKSIQLLILLVTNV